MHTPLCHITEWFPAKAFSGWIDPSGNLYRVATFDHAQFFEVVPEMQEAYFKYHDTVVSNDEYMNDCLDDLEPDEHPAWHRFDGINDEALDLLYKTAYDLGWVRFGICKSQSYYHPDKDFVIELCGSDIHLNKYTKYFEWIGKEYNSSITFFAITESTYSLFSYERREITKG